MLFILYTVSLRNLENSSVKKLKRIINEDELCNIFMWFEYSVCWANSIVYKYL